MLHYPLLLSARNAWQSIFATIHGALLRASTPNRVALIRLLSCHREQHLQRSFTARSSPRFAIVDFRTKSVDYDKHGKASAATLAGSPRAEN